MAIGGGSSPSSGAPSARPGRGLPRARSARGPEPRRHRPAGVAFGARPAGVEDSATSVEERRGDAEVALLIRAAEAERHPLGGPGHGGVEQVALPIEDILMAAQAQTRTQGQLATPLIREKRLGACWPGKFALLQTAEEHHPVAAGADLQAARPAEPRRAPAPRRPEWRARQAARAARRRPGAAQPRPARSPPPPGRPERVRPVPRRDRGSRRCPDAGAARSRRARRQSCDPGIAPPRHGIDFLKIPAQALAGPGGAHGSPGGAASASRPSATSGCSSRPRARR